MAASAKKATVAAPRATMLLIATRKGLWTLSSDAARRAWKLAGPDFLGHIVHHAIKDPRDGKTLLAAARTGHLGPTVFRSTDRGRTWKEAARPPALVGPASAGIASDNILIGALDFRYMTYRALILASVVAFLAGLAAVAVADATQRREIRARREMVQSRSAEVARMRALVDEVDAFMRSKTALQDRIEIINQRKQAQTGPVRALQVVAALKGIMLDAATVGPHDADMIVHAPTSAAIDSAANGLRDVTFEARTSQPGCGGKCVEAHWRIRLP